VSGTDYGVAGVLSVLFLIVPVLFSELMNGSDARFIERPLYLHVVQEDNGIKTQNNVSVYKSVTLED